MFKKFAIGLIATTLMAGSIYAQSNSRQQGSNNRQQGSNTRGNSAAYSQKQTDRENAKTRLKYVGLIQRGDFPGLTLTSAQRTALKSAVTENFDELNATTIALANLIPEDNRKAFQSSFLSAREEGMSPMAALKSSMADLELSEQVQAQVLAQNETRQVVMDRITGSVTELLTEEQKQTLMESRPAEMETETEAAAETSGSTSKPAGSAAKPAGSAARPAGSTKKGSTSR